MSAQTFEGLTRDAALRLIYHHTHRDYKGKLDDGTCTLLVPRDGGTIFVALDDLADDEIRVRYARQRAARLKKIPV